jgi:hypothetical protein
MKPEEVVDRLGEISPPSWKALRQIVEECRDRGKYALTDPGVIANHGLVAHHSAWFAACDFLLEQLEDLGKSSSSE